jgi:hypothetical protein
MTVTSMIVCEFIRFLQIQYFCSCFRLLSFSIFIFPHRSGRLPRDSIPILFSIEIWFSGPSSYRRQRETKAAFFSVGLGPPVLSFHFLVLGSVLLVQLAVPASGSCSQFRVCRSYCFSRVTCRTHVEGSRFLLGLSIARQESSQVRTVFPPVQISCRSYCFAATGIRFGCGPFSRTGSLSRQLRFPFRFWSASC